MELTKTKNHQTEDFFGSNLLKIFSNDFFQPFERQRIMRSNKPNANVMENKDYFQLELAVPGFDKNDLKISVDNDILTIYGSFESKTESQDSKYLVKEFSNEVFSRSYRINSDCDINAIDSTLKNGILYINIPKNKEKENKKMIEIK